MLWLTWIWQWDNCNITTGNSTPLIFLIAFTSVFYWHIWTPPPDLRAAGPPALCLMCLTTSLHFIFIHCYFYYVIILCVCVHLLSLSLSLPPCPASGFLSPLIGYCLHKKIQHVWKMWENLGQLTMRRRPVSGLLETRQAWTSYRLGVLVSDQTNLSEMGKLWAK